MQRVQRIIGGAPIASEWAPMIEIAGAVVLEGRERGMLGKDLGRRRDRLKAWPKPRRLRDLGRRSTSPASTSPGSGRKARWREMRRSELVTVPSFSPQAAAGRRTCGVAARCRWTMTFSETMKKVEPLQRGARPESRGGAADDTGWSPSPTSPGCAAPGDRVEHVDGLQPSRPVAMFGALPEAADAVDRRRDRVAHMGGELVGEPADLAPARWRWAGRSAKTAPARPADSAGRRDGS